MIYRLVAAGFRLFLLLVYRVRVEGAENVPATGPVIVCANHRSWWDIPLVGALLPRPVCFMAKAELFRYPLFGGLIRHLGAFPVRRDEADRGALRRALQLLATGRVLGVFPEGTRQAGRDLGRGQAGVAFLALQSGAPVIPVAISGRYGRGGGLTLHVGPPVELRGERGGRLRSADLQQLVDGSIMGAIAALMPPEEAADGGRRPAAAR